MTTKTLDKIIESHEEFDNGGLSHLTAYTAKPYARAVAIEYAASEVQRFAQHLKDQGFCPDLAYANHVQDCYVLFSVEGE